MVASRSSPNARKVGNATVAVVLTVSEFIGRAPYPRAPLRRRHRPPRQRQSHGVNCRTQERRPEMNQIVVPDRRVRPDRGAEPDKTDKRQCLPQTSRRLAAPDAAPQRQTSAADAAAEAGPVVGD